MNTKEDDSKDKLKGDDGAADSLNEAGSIGDEQCPAYRDKTDKKEWDGSASKAKGERLLPPKLREFLNGL